MKVYCEYTRLLRVYTNYTLFIRYIETPTHILGVIRVYIVYAVKMSTPDMLFLNL